MTLTDRSPATARLRAAWRTAHTPVPGVPRWARTAALAVPLTVLPSSLWRIAVCTFRFPIAPDGIDVAGAPSGIPGLPLSVYVVLLSIVSELFAYTSVGLVARWGEVWPRWVPWLRGRAVPTAAAVVVASAGSVALTLVWTWAAVARAVNKRVDGSAITGPTLLEVHDWQGWLTIACYAPLLLWGPLLGALTIGYWQRRRGSRMPKCGTQR